MKYFSLPPLLVDLFEDTRPRSGRPGRAGTQTGADERDAEAGQRPEDVQGDRREADDLEPCDVKKLKNQIRLDFDLFGGNEGKGDTTGGRAPAPCARPRAPCRDGRVERPSRKIGWPSRRRRRACAVVRGAELRT